MKFRMFIPKLQNFLFIICLTLFVSGCGIERSAESNLATIVVGSPNIQAKSGFARAVDANDVQIPNEITEILFRLTDSQNNLIAEFDALAAEVDNKINVLAGKHYELQGTAKAGEEIIYSGLVSISALTPDEARTVTVSLGSQFVINISVANEETPSIKPTIPVGSPNPTQLALDIQGLQNQNVTWYVNNELGGNESLGYIDNQGKYTPPLILPVDENGESINIQVKAIPEVAPSFSASLDIELVIDPDIIVDTVPPVVTVSLPGGLYNALQTVELSCDDCISIFFTTDGTAPTEDSEVHSAPLEITMNTELRFFAVDAANNRSATRTETYTFDLPPLTQAVPPAGVYNSSQSVALLCDDCEAIYFTLDGSLPNISSAVYTSEINVSEATTVRYFSIDASGNQEIPKSSRYTFDMDPPTSNASHDSGVYPAAINVVLNCEDCSSIHYTIDGTIPTQSSQIFRGSIDVSTSTTLNFFAVDEAGNIEQPHNSNNYQINIAGEQPIASLQFVDERLAACVNETAAENVWQTINDFTSLFCVDRGISDLGGIEVLSALTRLDLEGNNISSIDSLANLDGLTHLTLSFNNISDINPLSGLTNLNILLLNNNRIDEINALSRLTNLTELFLDDNNIVNIDVLTNLTKLSSIDISRNAITNINPISGLTGLTELYIDANQIREISALADLTELTKLRMSGNNIESIAVLRGLANLNIVDLADNNIIVISPLASLVNLSELNLKNNNINDIASFGDLINLLSISLDNNQITDISILSALTGLSSISLAGNNVTTGVAALTNLLAPDLIFLDNNPNIPCAEIEALDLRFDGDNAAAIGPGLGVVQWTDCGGATTGDGITVLSVSGLMVNLEGAFETACVSFPDFGTSYESILVITGFDFDFVTRSYLSSADCFGEANTTHHIGMYEIGEQTTIMGWIDELFLPTAPPLAANGIDQLSNSETVTLITTRITSGSSTAPDGTVTPIVDQPDSTGALIVDDTGPQDIFYNAGNFPDVSGFVGLDRGPFFRQ